MAEDRGTGVPGVHFGSRHSWTDWGLVLTERELGLPEVQTTCLEVPGRDGLLDLTESLTGGVVYGNRSLKFTFTTTEQLSGMRWYTLLGQIAAALHGQEVEILQDADADWFYVGRCSLDSFHTRRGASTIVITCSCQPYRQAVSSTAVEDITDLPGGVLGTQTLEVDGTAELHLVSYSAPACPVITCSEAMGLFVAEEGFWLEAGENHLTAPVLPLGESTLTLVGNGTVTIQWLKGVI